jgi:hypothetical protein
VRNNVIISILTAQIVSPPAIKGKFLQKYIFCPYHSVHRESISKNSNKVTLYSTLLFPVSRSTRFGHIPCPSSGAQITVLTACGVDKQCVFSHPRRRLDTHCLSTPDAVSTFNWAPDDGHGICPKHVERLTGNNKVLYSVILLEFFEIYIFLFLLEIVSLWAVPSLQAGGVCMFLQFCDGPVYCAALSE